MEECGPILDGPYIFLGGPIYCKASVISRRVDNGGIGGCCLLKVSEIYEAYFRYSHFRSIHVVL